MKRAFILLLDSFGLGATPDAAKYNDVGANTFGHIAAWAASAACWAGPTCCPISARCCASARPTWTASCAPVSYTHLTLPTKA